MKRNLFLLVLMWLTMHTMEAYSQCDPPSSTFTVASDPANCLGSGTITVSNVTGGTGVSYEYSLENTSDPGHAKPWQSSAVFTEVFSGSYNVLVRSVCATSSVYSSTVSQSVTVGGNYQALYITAVATSPVSRCVRGTITATAINGYVGPSSAYQYALVPSLNAPEPTGATKQTSNVFSNVEPGTYYVRVYDDCGTTTSYATTEVSVGALALDTYFNPFVINTYVDCDSIKISAILNDASNGFGAPGSSLTLEFPTGATLTGPFPTYPGTIATYGKKKLSDLYDINGPWPQNVVVKYDDGCPLLSPITKTVVKPEPNLVLTPVTVGCDTDPAIGVSVVFTQTQTPNSTCWDGFYEGCYGAVVDAKVSHITYSLNSGPWLTWDGLPIPISNPPNLDAKWCDGATVPVQYSAPDNDLTNTICETNVSSCIGKTGFAYNQKLNGNPVSVTLHFTQVPIGQPAIADVTFNSQLYDYNVIPQLQNLLPGTYEFDVSVATGCGIEVLQKSITLSNPYTASLTASLPPTCNSNATVQLTMVETNYKCPDKNGAYGSRYLQEYIGGVWTSEVFAAEPSATGMTYSITNVTPGVHKYRLVKTGIDNCGAEVTVTVGGGTYLTLTQDLATNLCPGVGLVKMTASGGTSHTYTLYQNSVSPSNIVAGPQALNSFSGLDPNLTYIVQTTNNCGTSVQSLVSFSNAPIPIFIEGQTPCIDSTITLKVYTFPDVDYQWYFDDGNGAVAIAGETNPTLTLTSLTTANKGSYYVTITYNTCTANSPVINLDPANCAIPGSVRGTIYHDANAGTIDGTPTNVDGQLWVDLMDGTTVVQSVPVQSNGTFFFPGVAPGSYTVVQRTATSTPGTPALPPTWYRTADGPNNPASTGDGTADGIISFSIAAGGEVTHLDFGINFNPLPVRLVGFKVAKESSTALLSWMTTSEENSKLFDVERSSDAKQWAKIASVPASNNSTQTQRYSATDFKPLNGVNYYRIRMVDNDFTFAYSPIRSTEFGGKSGIDIYPNPVRESFRINTSEWSDVKKVTIFNPTGNQVYTSGSTPQSVVNVQSLPSGLYIVKITYASGASENLKIVVSH